VNGGPSGPDHLEVGESWSTIHWRASTERDPCWPSLWYLAEIPWRYIIVRSVLDGDIEFCSPADVKFHIVSTEMTITRLS